MKNKLIAIFEKNKKGYLNLPTIRKILGIKKKLPNYEEKNQELKQIEISYATEKNNERGISKVRKCCSGIHHPTFRRRY